MFVNGPWKDKKKNKLSNLHGELPHALRIPLIAWWDYKLSLLIITYYKSESFNLMVNWLQASDKTKPGWTFQFHILHFNATLNFTDLCTTVSSFLCKSIQKFSVHDFTVCTSWLDYFIWVCWLQCISTSAFFTPTRSLAQLQLQGLFVRGVPPREANSIKNT